MRGNTNGEVPIVMAAIFSSSVQTEEIWGESGKVNWRKVN